MPKVSVVIPFFAGVHWLGEAIESVLRQTHSDFEIILVNDGSLEDVKGLLDKYSGKIRYFFKENGGPGSARNFGLEKATGQYIAYLDSDDLWEESKLEKQVGLMEASGAAWSHTSYMLFKEEEAHQAGKTIDVSPFQGDIFPRCLLSAPIATPCVMVRADVLKERPDLRFSERMRYGQDSLFWIKLAVRYPLAVVPGVLAKVRIRGGNAAKRARAQLQAKAQIWEEFLSGWKNRDGKKIDGITRAGYRMCRGANEIVKRTEQKGRFKTGTVENLSRFLYFLPYIVLKIRFFLSSKPDDRPIS